jgi:predicted DNA-binding transcriptional regulator AlpA
MRNEKLDLCIAAMPTVTKELLTRKQIAGLFQISTQTIIRWENVGKLPALRLGAGSVRYLRSDVEKLIQDSVTRAEVKA